MTNDRDQYYPKVFRLKPRREPFGMRIEGEVRRFLLYIIFKEKLENLYIKQL